MDVFTDPAVHEYLDRLRLRGAELPPADFEELWETVCEHIAESVHRGEPVPQALARLGSPDDIVAAAEEAGGGTRPATAAPRTRTWLTVLTLVLLAGGIAVCGVGWIAGVVLLWLSDRWKLWEKLVGTVLFPVALVAIHWVQTRNGGGDSMSSAKATTGLLLATIPNAVFVVYLAVKARPGRAGFSR